MAPSRLRDGHRPSADLASADTAAMQTHDSRVRVTQVPGRKVLVERLQAHGHWEVREYGQDHSNILVEVRPNGSLLPMGRGLVHSSREPILVDASVLDTVLAQLGRAGPMQSHPA
jgi:hypothetical protein